MALHKQQFSSELDPDLLARAKAIAASENRPFELFIEEAVSHLVKRKCVLRPEIQAAHEECAVERTELYRHLAK